MGDEQAIEPLIERLEKESGRVRTALVDALESISGEEFGASPAAWKGWWEREGESIRERGFTTGVKEPDPERPNRYREEEDLQKTFISVVSQGLKTHRIHYQRIRGYLAAAGCALVAGDFDESLAVVEEEADI